MLFLFFLRTNLTFTFIYQGYVISDESVLRQTVSHSFYTTMFLLITDLLYWGVGMRKFSKTDNPRAVITSFTSLLSSYLNVCLSFCKIRMSYSQRLWIDCRLWSVLIIFWYLLCKLFLVCLWIYSMLFIWTNYLLNDLLKKTNTLWNNFYALLFFCFFFKAAEHWTPKHYLLNLMFSVVVCSHWRNYKSILRIATIQFANEMEGLHTAGK